MMIPPFKLPSKPTVTITLNEATVSDCLDFADVDPAHEEEITTLFLDRMQDKATFVDSKTWTGSDRRFGLFWYWLHTTDDVEMAVTYKCGYCGESHTFLQDCRKLADGYKSIAGLPSRDIEVDGKKIVVKPLGGAALEALESFRGAVEGRRTYRELMEIERLSQVADIPRADIDGMKIKQYGDFREKVENALSDMQHGLESEEIDGKISLIMQPHECPNNKEGKTRVRVSFRHLDFIPAV